MALVLEGAFSFLGGVDSRTGKLLIGEDRESVSGKVLVFPVGRGSTVGSYVMLDLRRSGNAPVAIVNAKAEPIVATGAVMAEIPMVDGIDISLIRTGDRVIVDADAGRVELPGVVNVHAATSILRNEGRLLILHRSHRVGSCQGMWAGVSGYVERGEKPMETAFREIAEEVGQRQPCLVKEGEPLLIRNGNRVWTIHPFLFDVIDREIVTDWEHVGHAWISSDELESYPTVPGLDRVFRSLGLL